jgi:hypothetical protein
MAIPSLEVIAFAESMSAGRDSRSRKLFRQRLAADIFPLKRNVGLELSL